MPTSAPESEPVRIPGGALAVARGPRLARRLRALTGVDERLLARVWPERTKYTALGGVVLGTSVIAAFSMWNFASEAMGEASFLALLPALVWMLFVLCLDLWLVAPQAAAKRRAGPLVMRLLVAVLLGVVVAEPLVLRVFQTAVEERIRDERHTELDTLRTHLLRCNPDPSQAKGDLPPAGCDTYVLSFGASPGVASDELAGLREKAAALQRRVDLDTQRLEALDNEVRTECRRLIRDARTGLLNRTSECVRLRQQAADYRATHRTAENERKLSELTDRIASGGSALASSRATFVRDRDRAVERRVAEERDQQRGIGVLERMRALEELARGNPTLFAGVWLLRLLFILIDVLPALVKFISGESSYDRLLSSRVNSAVKVHEEEVRAAERELLADFEIARERCEQRIRRHKAEVEAERREHTAAMNIRVRQAVNNLEDEIRSTTPV